MYSRQFTKSRNRSGGGLVTVCCRGGSKRIKGKNLVNFCGKPLVAWTIEQALEFASYYEDYYTVAVHTDDEDIERIAKEYEDVIIVPRPAEYADDSSAKISAIRYVYKALGGNFEQVVDLDVTNPCRTIENICAARALQRKTEVDCIFSVSPSSRSPYFNMVEFGNDHKIRLCKDKGEFTTTQSTPKTYDLNASIYVYSKNFMDGYSLSPITDNTAPYIMSEWSRNDIDDPMDLLVVETIFKHKFLGGN